MGCVRDSLCRTVRSGLIARSLGVGLMPGSEGQTAALLPIPLTGWRLVTDGVMGGHSTGEMRVTRSNGQPMICLQGDVRTENNGGFLQLARDLDDPFAARAAQYDGVEIEVLGNGEHYNVHLRTHDLLLPWQAYRASFLAIAQWRRVRLPLADFAAYKTATDLRLGRLKRIGMVAIGRPFEADLCIRAVAFYRAGG